MSESPRGIRNEARFLFEQVQEKTTDGLYDGCGRRGGGTAIKKQ